MTNQDRTAQEFPLVEGGQLEEAVQTAPDAERVPDPVQAGQFSTIWQTLTQIGWAEPALRLGTHMLSVAVVLLVVWAMRNFYLNSQLSENPAVESQPAPELPTPIPTTQPIQLPAFSQPSSDSTDSIQRQTTLHTTIPTRPRVDVITYTVQTGDNLFAIAENFGLKPETILWGNYDTLQDNPHLLQTDQVLNILPVNGTYHMWREGESFQKVAQFYKVEPEEIIAYAGNRFDVLNFSMEEPPLEPGTWLIVPGGERLLKDWGPPAISRTNPARASYYGPGHCGSVYEGAIGNGTFSWPTTNRGISGYGYNPPIHPAIDIAGSMGNAIFATDAGVVVYAGWSNYGYGYLIVVDHGNGWASAYAHLSALNVVCGQSVFQGTVIGGLGSTGRSTGPHLHFELIFNGAKVNPINFLQ